MKRTFIAVNILPDPKLKEVYELIRYRLRLEKINWLQADLMHITLNFLGDTEEGLLADIIRSMEGILKGQTSFELTLRSVGVFKSLREPRVIWIGCDICDILAKLKARFDFSLAALGFKPEVREFSPHLTLGRIKEMRQQNQLAQVITQYKEVVFQKQKIDHVVLYESMLKPEGVEYVPLQVFSLNEQ